ncbi:MAG TPA: glycosyltransferase family 4 protein [Nitrososphaerales archaeon]|nr:glycosyltransferase family 4 protein [Nitrososphaerales archaeon]
MTLPGANKASTDDLRTLIVTFDPPENIGGVEGRLAGYVRELVRTNHYVEVEAFSPSHRLSSTDFHGASLHNCPSRLRSLPQTSQFTLKRFRVSQINSVFLLSGGITIFGLLLLFYCRLTRRRNAILLYGKDVLQARGRLLGRLLIRASTGLADCVFANSRYTASLVPFVRPRKVRILYPGVDPSIAAQPLAPSDPYGKKILFVGRLVERKGVKDLVDALKIVSEGIQDASLEVVGDGPQRSQLERLVADLNLGNRVSFLGTLKGSTLYDRYASCNVFAMPSITLNDDAEGFGTVFLEAGLFGKPSVGTFSGGIPEAVEQNRTGLLVHEGQVAELATALQKLLIDADFARSLGRNARQRVLRNFTWAEGTDLLMNSLAKARVGKRS